VVSTERGAACAQGHTTRPRTGDAARRALEFYGLQWSERADFEIDHLVPRCIGGASPLNHWPQPLGVEWGAEKKDMLQRQLCTEICLSRDDGPLAATRPPSPRTGQHCGTRPSDEPGSRRVEGPSPTRLLTVDHRGDAL
jgi:hypothetical protein